MGTESFTLFGVFIVFVLFTPGYIFRRFYFQGYFSKQFSFGLFAEKFITSLIIGLFIQVLLLIMVNNFSYFSIKESYGPVTQFFDQISHNQLPEVGSFNIENIFIYLVFSFFISALFGHSLNKIVRIFHLDVRYRMFKFSNSWYYYFKGDLDFRKRNRKGKVISTLVDVIADIGEDKTKLYSGVLTEYTVAHDGELKTITIAGANRYSRSKNSWVEIQGDCLIVPYNKVFNINLRYDVKKSDKRIRQQVFDKFTAVISSVSFFIIPILIPYFFYYRVGLMRVILGILVGWVAWIMITAIFVVIKKRKEKDKYESPFVIFLFALGFIYLTYLILS